MAYPSNPQMWHYYFKRENFQDAINFYNDCKRTWDNDCPPECEPTITATPSHIYVGCETDSFTFGDCGENEESELWYSRCDFIETHECTRIYNPNKKW
jgi:hypothetical protein